MLGVKVSVENGKVDFNRIQNQFQRNQNGNHVFPRNKTKDSDKEHDCTDYKVILHFYHNTLFLFTYSLFLQTAKNIFFVIDSE